MNEPKMRRAWGHKIKEKLFYFLAFIIFFLICFPIFWAVLCSFKTHEEMFSVPLKIIPTTLTIEHYKKLILSSKIPLFFFNSLLVATGTSILTIFIASLAAYSLTRFPFPGIGLAARSILFCYMLPPVLLSIPFFLMLNKVHLLNSRIGLLYCHTSLALPFVIWLFWGFFRTIPVDIEEAAKIDGSGRMRILVDIFFPLALPGIVAGFVFTFIVSWSDYLFSSIILTKEAVQTLPVAIAMIMAKDFITWEVVLPAMGLATIPVLLITIVLQKYLLEGFSAPIVKG
jgi:ABC-type glycerol-3-phosphate transport system permease component